VGCCPSQRNVSLDLGSKRVPRRAGYAECLTLQKKEKVSMDMKLIIIIGFSYLYGFFEVFMNWRQRSKVKMTSSGDKRSLWVLYALITIGYFLSFSIGATKIGRISYWDTCFAIAVTLTAIGLIIRIQSILTLKQYFTYSVAKVDDHQLIQTGLYRVIRHPGYLGQLILFIGISISLSNWLSILAMTIPILIGYGYRIHVEERFMLEQFGKNYLDYQRRTKRIIPVIY
jgi:protein-S-isoprenylcysteine O-methyltransferase Ste14